MEAPSPRYILTRAVFLIVSLIVVLYGIRFVKKKQRESAIVAELKSITSDSSFFHQFYPEEARKTLVRAIGLIAEAKQLGVDPDVVIDRSLNVQAKFFATDEDKLEPPPRVKIISSSLRGNYENFRKLGYTGDFQTLRSMKEGTLPLIPSGPEEGKQPLVGTLIDAEVSPGIEKVIANLQIRPPQTSGHAMSDIEIAAAKQLARDLADAKVIEEPVRDRILATLSPPPEDPKAVKK